MNNKLVIKMKRRTQMEWLLWILMVMPFLFSFLNELLGLPWSIRYFMDAAWCTLFVYQLIQKRNTVTVPETWVWLFLIYTLLVYLVQFQSPLYYLWGLRNNFRFYVAFFAFAAFMTVDGVSDFTKLLDKLFWVNVIVSVWQFVFLDLDGDYLGGLFSTESGGNGYTNIFFLIIVTKSIIFYLEKREKTGACFAKCAAALVVAAMAELKFFYLEFILVICLCVMLTNFTWRKFALVFGGVIGVALCVALLISLFPSYIGWFTLRGFFESASSRKGYTSIGDLNRLIAIPQINELWLRTIWQRLFGMGLGNTDTSNYAALNTPFFVSNGDMHYSWISYAMMYLETGWIGLIFYWGFYVVIWFSVLRMEKHCAGIAKSYCKIARIMAVLCVVISVYNSSLRNEAGYMIYFIMAIPFVLCKADRRKNICPESDSLPLRPKETGR